MAKINFRGKFQNNRRREANVVSLTVPVVFGEADLREGKEADTLKVGALVACLDVPGGIILQSAYLVVSEAADAATTLKFDIGTDAILGATAIDALGLTDAALTPLLVTDAQTITATVGGANSTVGEATLVIEYLDYTRATMSYIGEE